MSELYICEAIKDHLINPSKCANCPHQHPHNWDDNDYGYRDDSTCNMSHCDHNGIQCSCVLISTEWDN